MSMFWIVKNVCDEAYTADTIDAIELLKALNKLFEEPCASQYHGRMENLVELYHFIADLPYDYWLVTLEEEFHPGTTRADLDREELEYYLPVVHTIMKVLGIKTVGFKNNFYKSYSDV